MQIDLGRKVAGGGKGEGGSREESRLPQRTARLPFRICSDRS
jgi:hypothetical protein